MKAAGIAVQALDTGRVLLVRRTPGEDSSAVWELPGGRAEAGESAWETALREWSEETGAVLTEPARGGFSRDGYECFVVDVPRESDLDLAPDRHEVSEARWWAPEDMDASDVRDDLVEELSTLRPLLKSEWSDFHERTDDAVDAFTPRVEDAMASAVPAKVLAPLLGLAKGRQSPQSRNQASTAYASQLAALTGTAGAAVGVAGATVAISGLIAALLAVPLVLGPLAAVIVGIYVEAWRNGHRGAVAAVRGSKAVQFAADGALLPLQRLRADAPAVARGIAEDMRRRIADAIAHAKARGIDVEELAAEVYAIIHDERRARMVAETEYARAQNAAHMAVYRANGVPMVAWLAEPTACRLCKENEAVSPQPTNDPQWPNGPIPVHPHERCAVAPSYPDVA
ncbi:MAG TPA: NUDIX domain-containing protein [Mycobacteriales bacterium]